MPNAGNIFRLAPEQLKPGMIVAIDVMSIHGSVVVHAHTPIDTTLIKRIMISGSDIVYIFSALNETNKAAVIEKDITDKTNQLRDEIFNIKEDGELRQEALYGIITNAVGLAENMGGINKYLKMMREKNEYTFTHSMSVGMMSNLFAKWLKLTEGEAHDLTVASSMHDIGKLSIDTELLEKPGKLTADEFAAMKKHVEHGIELLKISKAPDKVILAVSEHHERSDGSGYPYGRGYGYISELGSMLAIADVYDALVSKRTYRDAMCPFQAMEIMYRDKFSHFKFDMLDTFIANIVYTYMGAHIELNDGRSGEVIFINPAQMLRPYIRIEGGEIINLEKEPEIKIRRVI
jgi:putative nucleotidyltransferase with HDIG domain